MDVVFTSEVELKKQKRVLKQIMRYEISKGHLKWKLTDVARTANVGRTLIYYHFGKTKQEIFDTCLDLVADEFYGLSEERLRLVREKGAMDCLQKSRRFCLEVPEFMMFYMRYRSDASFSSARLLEIEKLHRAKLQNVFPSASELDIYSLQALLKGLVSSQLLDQKAFDYALSLVRFPDINP